MSYQTYRQIPKHHPSLAGHFPGNPIVPGVIILEEVIQALQQWRKDYQVTGIPAAKFLKPLPPDQTFTIKLIDNKGGRVKFVCTVDNQPLAQGQLKVKLKEQP
jgi:3-hydroxymyristoyl/3-hydroxydecanoyl-(acyl carrier protein) dehydratase